jgi:hypothetical protein
MSKFRPILQRINVGLMFGIVALAGAVAMRHYDIWLLNSIDASAEAGTDDTGHFSWAALSMGKDSVSVPDLARLWNETRDQPESGWQDRVDRLMVRLAPQANYSQYEGPDVSQVDAVSRTGRRVGLLYDDGTTPSRVVELLYLGELHACIIDSRSESHWTWMTRDELTTRWLGVNGKGWVIAMPKRAGRIEPNPVGLLKHEAASYGYGRENTTTEQDRRFWSAAYLSRLDDQWNGIFDSEDAMHTTRLNWDELNRGWVPSRD